jgi:hypothetical protein
MGLERFEVALRPSVNGQAVEPVTGVTLPLGEPCRDGAELARASRDRWGVPRAEVEAEMRARVEVGGSGQTRIGRSYRGPAS